MAYYFAVEMDPNKFSVIKTTHFSLGSVGVSQNIESTRYGQLVL